jgi:hypothetical protein
LEIGNLRPLLVKLISETVKERGNPPTFYRKLSTQFIQQQKTHQNWMKNKNKYISFKYGKILNLGHL